ncbi:MAG: polysaccharide biosynthesis/export family protein [Gemmatimonadaceae bacterium]|nr:polysaccharide biosynthesis/export family protein [Gemmatimonadaceae bacterium]
MTRNSSHVERPRALVSGAARVRRMVGLAVLALGASACRSTAVQGPYVWASTIAPEPARAAYLIQAGDQLSVQVWSNEALSVKARVRSDGKFTVPLLGEIPVIGQSPESLAASVQQKLADAKIVLSPRVTVIVDEEVTVSVLGKVTRAGSYPLTGARGVADALAAAGGLTEFAHRDRIYVLRRIPEPQRIRFTFGSLFDQSDPSARFKLRSGDVILVD